MATGAGPRPPIDAGGVAEYAIGVIDADHVTISGLEATNDAPSPAPRIGILLRVENRGANVVKLCGQFLATKSIAHVKRGDRCGEAQPLNP